MFIIEQIKAAHSKVKSGADFPNYVQDIIKLGVIGYETYVCDGHSLYFGKNSYKIQSPEKYAELKIADQSNKPEFQQALKAHQQGQTDYLTFCATCAGFGVEKWVVDVSDMTCTYFDKAGKELLVEIVPSA